MKVVGWISSASHQKSSKNIECAELQLENTGFRRYPITKSYSFVTTGIQTSHGYNF